MPTEPPAASAVPAAQDVRAALDPVAELKLRRWARLNHVPAADRDPRWHAVVWQEMTARDRELAALPVDVNHAGVRRLAVHAPHAGVRGPASRARAGRPAAGVRG